MSANPRNPRSSPKARPARAGNLVMWAVIGVAVVALAAFFALRGAAPNDAIAGLQTFSGLSRDHRTAQVSYPQAPPVGGAHSAQWLTCGIYDQPVPNENAVHSMEHGAAWVAYRPDIGLAQVDKLKGLVRGKAYTLLSPYPGMNAPVVAAAWGVRLELQSADDARLPKFIQKYAGGPQAPEPGASCTGGTGTPSE